MLKTQFFSKVCTSDIFLNMISCMNPAGDTKTCLFSTVWLSSETLPWVYLKSKSDLCVSKVLFPCLQIARLSEVERSDFPLLRVACPFPDYQHAWTYPRTRWHSMLMPLMHEMEKVHMNSGWILSQQPSVSASIKTAVGSKPVFPSYFKNSRLLCQCFIRSCMTFVFFVSHTCTVAPLQSWSF